MNWQKQLLISSRSAGTSCVSCLIALALTIAPRGVADGKKTYRNPLIPERDLADPDVIRVDGKYYLYPTSDGRGFEVFVSDDLVHWENKGQAFKDSRRGDWAPDVFQN